MIIFTSSNEQNDIVNSYKHGANNFIRKPVDSEKLNVALEYIGLQWVIINEQAKDS